MPIRMQRSSLETGSLLKGFGVPRALNRDLWSGVFDLAEIIARWPDGLLHLSGEFAPPNTRLKLPARVD